MRDRALWDPSFLCEDLLLDSMLYEIPRCFLLWPVHWSLINALRMKVIRSVSKIILEGEVIFSPELLSVLQKDQAGLCQLSLSAIFMAS